MLFTFLFITFLFNGEVKNTYLASTTSSQCINDIGASLAVLENMGATVITAYCTFEGEYE